MTTSFTTSDEFDPQGGGFDGEPDYPEFLGVTFTPTVTGIAIAVGGLLVAIYLTSTQVLPAWTELSTLNQEKEEKQSQLDKIGADQLDIIIAERKAQLEQSQDLKQDVMALFTNESNLETLLLDISSFADLTSMKINSYVPEGEKQPLANDSLGNLAQNNVQVQNYNLDVEGTFSQLQIFLQDLERLQPLLVVQNLNTSTLEPATYLLENEQLSTVGEPILKTTVTVKAVFADVKPPVQETPEEE